MQYMNSYVIVGGTCIHVKELNQEAYIPGSQLFLSLHQIFRQVFRH